MPFVIALPRELLGMITQLLIEGLQEIKIYRRRMSLARCKAAAVGVLKWIFIPASYHPPSAMGLYMMDANWPSIFREEVHRRAIFTFPDPSILHQFFNSSAVRKDVELAMVRHSTHYIRIQRWSRSTHIQNALRPLHSLRGIHVGRCLRRGHMAAYPNVPKGLISQTAVLSLRYPRYWEMISYGTGPFGTNTYPQTGRALSGQEIASVRQQIQDALPAQRERMEKNSAAAEKARTTRLARERERREERERRQAVDEGRKREMEQATTSREGRLKARNQARETAAKKAMEAK